MMNELYPHMKVQCAERYETRALWYFSWHDPNRPYLGLYAVTTGVGQVVDFAGWVPFLRSVYNQPSEEDWKVAYEWFNEVAQLVEWDFAQK